MAFSNLPIRGKVALGSIQDVVGIAPATIAAMPILLTPRGTSMTTQASAAIDDRDGSAEAFPSRVLIAPPKTLTIPIFALQAEAGRPAIEVWGISEKDEDHQLDKQAYGHLRSGRYGEHRFLTIRHRKGTRTACYASWLAFPDGERATAFIQDHSRYGLENILAASIRRKETIERELENGLAKGRYNLGLIEESVRYRWATLFVDRQDEIRKLSRQAADIRGLRAALTAVAHNGLVG